ncbi:uncharacterized protein BDZ83DRAFT_32892 [Colletotrichum acutatum]|uniref:Uncharacterized protein n=1 Tax=Glomerella acutata TaxID=27357 RepID=A0AAD8XLE0_GLOAC|nr:uncharacterized protein BDZ83DRAFT_32892 [Colletotrichum acutatum]KAK1729469.1 hypothetical protein BDZ83DRAFT_32892 [Colletotrichum acutatum]
MSTSARLDKRGGELSTIRLSSFFHTSAVTVGRERQRTCGVQRWWGDFVRPAGGGGAQRSRRHRGSGTFFFLFSLLLPAGRTGETSWCHARAELVSPGRSSSDSFAWGSLGSLPPTGAWRRTEISRWGSGVCVV